MPRTKINYEDGCDDPNNFEYLQDSCSGYAYSEYAFDSDYVINNEFEYSNALTNQNTYEKQKTEKPSDKSVEEFLAYLDSLVKMG